MSESSGGHAGYRVSCSERVRKGVRELLADARRKGRETQVLDALKEMDRRLHIYPQFGEPIRDLPALPGTLWIGVIPPLVVHYAVDDERRLVMVGLPIVSLPEMRI